MNILFIGDIVSESGRQTLKLYLPAIKNRYDIDFTIVNGENVAHGNGISLKMYNLLLELGADAITLGNHFIASGELITFLNLADKLVRPYNIHKSIPGAGSRVFKVKDKEVRVTNLLGKVFIDSLNPTCPFEALDEVITNNQTPIHIVDLHAEATAEKVAIGWYLDGKVSAVIGTHTHVQTADERILPQGTGYLSDVGMCGPYNGIIGLRRDIVIERMRTGLKSKNDIQTGDIQFNAVVLQIDESTGKTIKMSRVSINPDRMIGL